MSRYITLKLTEHEVGVLLGALRNESMDEPDNYYDRVYLSVGKKCVRAGFANHYLEIDGIVDKVRKGEKI